MRACFCVVRTFVAFLVVGAVVAGCSTKPAPAWSTRSPAEQGGLRLVGVGPQVPEEIRKAGLQEQTFEAPGTVAAWIEVVDRSLYDGKSDSTGLRFFLSGSSSERLTAYPDASESVRDDRQFLVVLIPPGYGPEYAGGSLKATSQGKDIAEWRFDAFPKLLKQIDDGEPDVTKGQALGYDIRLAGQVQVEPMSTLDPKGMKVVRCSLAVSPSVKAQADRDPVELDLRLTRTTWNTLTNPPGESWALSSGSVVPVMFECPYADSVRRIEVPLTVRRYRTLVEPAVFRNVRVLPPASDMPEGTYRLAPTQAQTVVTPSGLKVTLPAGEVQRGIRVPGLTFEAICEPGYEGIDLPQSALCRSTGKPVSIELGLWVNGRLSSFESSRPKPGETWHGSAGWKRLPGKGPWVIPELKVAVEQKAVLEEKELKLLLPVANAGAKR